MLLFRELDSVLQQFRSVTVVPVFIVHHQIFQQHDEAAFRRANSEQQVNHAHDRVVTPQNKNATAIRLLENQSQTAQLLVLVRAKILFLGEKFPEQLGQFVQIRLRRRLDDNFFAHPTSLIPERDPAGKCDSTPETGVRGAIDNRLSLPNLPAPIPRVGFEL